MARFCLYLYNYNGMFMFDRVFMCKGMEIEKKRGIERVIEREREL